MANMIEIAFPDGAVRSYPESTSVYEVASSIGARLAKDMVAAKLDGLWVDTHHLIHASASIEIVTKNSDEALAIIRHSTAHLMAQAVQQLYPAVQITVGPVTDDGFYYDFYHPPGFGPDDLEAIEQKMHALVSQNLDVRRSEMKRDDARVYFAERGQHFKAKIIDELIDAPSVSLYTQGDFTDLCRGPHVPNTSFLGAFKLTKLSGAYWRGDQNNEMLQRIYGTAWRSKKELNTYLERIALAKKRDHRLLGPKLDWFHFQEEAPGMVFWHADGWQIYQNVLKVVRTCYQAHHYQEVNTPQLVDRKLWEASGHWDKYADNMFVIDAAEKHYAVKPMSCPCHVELFKQGLRSYKDLPFRLAEFGHCHRAEPSGTLHGLMRLRGFVQDDGHVFCAESQIGAEVAMLIDQTLDLYKKFGFHDVTICLSTRPEKRVGDDGLWDKAEAALTKTLDDVVGEGAWRLQPGEGAFYGPKIEFALRDSLERVWQCGTIQLDFSMPQKLGAFFVDESGQKQHPVMVHRAVLGSIERFIGILIEETDARLPLWLMPQHCQILTISSDCDDYARRVLKKLVDRGVQARIDLRNEKIGYKIREHAMKRVPYLLICGEREKNAGAVNVRDQHGTNLGSMAVDAFLARIEQELVIS